MKPSREKERESMREIRRRRVRVREPLGGISVLNISSDQAGDNAALGHVAREAAVVSTECLKDKLNKVLFKSFYLDWHFVNLLV